MTPSVLCEEHRAQAREARRGSVRQLRGEVEDLKLENAELRGRLAAFEVVQSQGSELAEMQAQHGVMTDEYRHMASIIMAFYQIGFLPREAVPGMAIEIGVEADPGLAAVLRAAASRARPQRSNLGP